MFKKEEKRNINKLSIAIALILTWVSIWASFQPLPYSGDPFADPDIISAKAGFPFTVFYYPVPPFGNDVPDQGSIFPFALNVMLFFILAWVLLRIIPEKYISKRIERLTVYIAFWVTLAGLLHTILLFD